MQLTKYSETGVCLFVETVEGSGDYFPLDGQDLHMFHGTRCRHYVAANESEATRVSLDFRIGVMPFYDPSYKMEGVPQHGRRLVVA